MIDVMKRLAEIDSTNPNVVKEGYPPIVLPSDEKYSQALARVYGQPILKNPKFPDLLARLKRSTPNERDLDIIIKTGTLPNHLEENAVAECGMEPMGLMGGMPSMEQNKPQTPASINMTAGSGDELANMLATIMQLAGVKQVGADDLGVEPQPAVVTAEPAMGVGPAVGDRDDMRSVLDKLNPMDGDDEKGDSELGAFQQDSGEEGDDEEGDDEEETDEGEYNNSPASAEPKKPFNSNEFANQENQPGQGNRMDGNMPKATMEQTLMAAYKQFVGE